jgi:hypothetical protein
LWRGEPVALMAGSPPSSIDAGRSLFITDQSVIEDESLIYTPCGKDGMPAGTKLAPFSFGRLMKDLAGTNDAGTYARNWLLQLDPPTPTTVNGFPVPNRPGVRSMFLVPWCQAGSSTAACDKDDPTTLDLDISIAPFRLLAIVNRIDLADVFGYAAAEPTNGGELRFVFVGEKAQHCGATIQFFVIFEYRVQVADCAALTKWAQDWIDLAGLPSGPTYNAKLKTLVDSVVTKPNALARIRTNEVTFAGPSTEEEQGETWEMRQFEPAADKLVQTVLNRTPDRSFRVDPALARLKTWIETPPREQEIALDRQEFDATLAPGDPLLAASAPLRPPAFTNVGTFWELPGVGTASYQDTRHHVSLNSCNGCHAGETDTPGSHVLTSGTFGTPVELSGFLKGKTVQDPRKQQNALNQVMERTYDDLTRRGQVLACIAQGFGTPCLCNITLQKLSMSH